ncbi:hypothetical protein HII36_01950 [Nonomuraea sp. NN258]|uniref:hypothetical protein n=1 Tax=Nonomuraea antri TaxID=2730852 RepID=UPI001568B99F|nr:hypothetical protein [Nonomuraea antri]NRQ30608.1 hypothetical protein [Nonomuraea antri]
MDTIARKVGYTNAFALSVALGAARDRRFTARTVGKLAGTIQQQVPAPGKAEPLVRTCAKMLSTHVGW